MRSGPDSPILAFLIVYGLFANNNNFPLLFCSDMPPRILCVLTCRVCGCGTRGRGDPVTPAPPSSSSFDDEFMEEPYMPEQ